MILMSTRFDGRVVFEGRTCNAAFVRTTMVSHRREGQWRAAQLQRWPRMRVFVVGYTDIIATTSQIKLQAEMASNM